MEALEEQVKCPVCLEKYKEAKGLSCLHSFCQTCINKLPTTRDENGTATLKCPTCRTTVALPPEGVAALPKAFHINTLLDLYNALNTPVAEKGEVPLCPLHNRARDFYCKTEDEVICCVCAVRGHKEHHCDTADLFYEQVRNEVEAKFDLVKEHIEIIKDAIVQSDLLVERVKLQALDVKKEIGQFDELSDDVTKEKNHLLSEVDAHVEKHLGKQEEKRDTLNTMLAQFQSSGEYVENTLKSEKPEQILFVRRQLLLHMNALIMHIDKSAYERKESVIFFNLSGNKCTNIGNTCQVVFDDCYISGYRRFVGKVGEPTSFFLHVKGIDGQYVSLPTNHTINISSSIESTIDSIAFSLEKEENHYKVSWTPTVAGPHTVKCLIGNVHIPGSPFITRAITSCELGIMSRQVKSIGKFHIPCGVCLKEDGTLIVAERKPCNIVQLNQANEVVHAMTCGKEQLPGIYSGIAIMRNGDILAVDSKKNCLMQFSENGQCQIIGSYGSGPLQFDLPYSIAVHPKDGKVFITDRGNSRVHVLYEDLTYCTSFGSRGKDPGQFDTPFDIAIDSKGFLLCQTLSLEEYRNLILIMSPLLLYFLICLISYHYFDGQDILHVLQQRQPIRGFFTIVIGVMHNHNLTLINCRKGTMKFLAEFEWSKGCPDYGCTSRIIVNKSNGFLYIVDPCEDCIYIL